MSHTITVHIPKKLAKWLAEKYRERGDHRGPGRLPGVPAQRTSRGFECVVVLSLFRHVVLSLFLFGVPGLVGRPIQITNQLRAKGTPIPINDVWIAAHCLGHGALLISTDAHFDQVEGLRR